jgi:pimeloyl-ACP methyl ester carboxylesterase
MGNHKNITEKIVPIDSELDIYYQESGDGDIPILLVPGWTMTTRVFEHQLEFFSESEEYRFITFDPRSHGQSTKTEGGHFYEQHGRDLHRFIETLYLKNVVLGGWSFGTLATLSYVNQYGHDRLGGFIMLDGPPKAAGEESPNAIPI